MAELVYSAWSVEVVQIGHSRLCCRAAIETSDALKLSGADLAAVAACEASAMTCFLAVESKSVETLLVEGAQAEPVLVGNGSCLPSTA